MCILKAWSKTTLLTRLYPEIEPLNAVNLNQSAVFLLHKQTEKKHSIRSQRSLAYDCHQAKYPKHLFRLLLRHPNAREREKENITNDAISNSHNWARVQSLPLSSACYLNRITRECKTVRLSTFLSGQCLAFCFSFILCTLDMPTKGKWARGIEEKRKGLTSLAYDRNEWYGHFSRSKDRYWFIF